MKEEKMSSTVGERQFGRHFKRQFERGYLRVKNCRETVGSQFLPRGIKMSRRALWVFLRLRNSGSVRVRFLVRFPAVKVPTFGGFPVESPTNKATAPKPNLRGISLSEYGSGGFRVRLRRLSKCGSVAYLVERPTRETQAEQYSDNALEMPLI